MKYIHQTDSWPRFTWDIPKITSLLGPVRNRQGRLLGRMEALGLPLRSEAVLQTLTLDVVKSSEIEGQMLDLSQVRSSIARRLGIDIGGLIHSDRHVEGVVEMMLDATQHFNKPLTKDRLLGWHASLFPTGRSGMHKITVGAWRRDIHGPMRVVSGPVGRQKVHFEAPEAGRLSVEMKNFLDWFKNAQDLDPVLKAGMAHLWFVTIHPFDDGNGRIARAIADLQLARADGSRERFYSMSVQIRQERNAYYDILEKTQKSTDVTKRGIDITKWLEWFLSCLNRSLDTTENTLAVVLKKAQFWQRHTSGKFNERQKTIINELFDGFEGKLTSSKWAKITKCSQDTAWRDINDLIDKGILLKDTAGGRSTSYVLKYS
ncbi:MAG: Fic family protein [Candidatus Omnitrophica bacterium]|nr:Fic family protein [Candidatus Omnitrophota bacterium]MDE2215022.1 Fic family protein [Candidatus Omnitrophota bacterium]MDE2232194.1 Fic family protein [Candidatus Omnitrophota bacterium]